MKIRFTLLMMTAMLLSFGTMAAQQWTTYTTADGLASNTVNSIAIDAQGNKWFASGNLRSAGFSPGQGISRFDGITWITYTTANGLPNNTVSAIAIDAQNNLWAGTNGGGVARFNGTAWATVKEFSTDPFAAIMSIAIDAQGNPWLGTFDNGILRYSAGTWPEINNGLGSTAINSIIINSDGIVWAGTAYGLARWDGNSWTNFLTSDGLVNNNVTSIAIDNQGWIGTEGGLSRFDGTTWTNYTTANGLISNDIRSIAIDNQGNKWIGTSSGLSRFDGKNWTNYTTANGLASNDILAVAVDAQDNIWIGTNGGGVSKFTPGATGVAEGAEKTNTNVFPNPGNGNFVINIPDITDKATIEIYNELGVLVYSTSIYSGHEVLDLSDKAKGAYIYRVKNEKGSIAQGTITIQ